MPLGFFLDEFNRRISDEQKYHRDKADKLDESDRAFLLKLAESGDPSIQAIAGAALMEMASGMREGRGRTRKSGLRGFLGEVEQSPYLAMIQQALGQARGGAPAAPPTAALPASSPVQGGGPMNPAMVGQGAPAPPLAGQTPQGAARPVAPQQIDGVTAMMPAPAVPLADAFTALQRSQAPQPAAMAPPPPPPPPKPAIVRLFPDAYEQAARTQQAQIEGLFAGVQRAGELTGASQDWVRDTFQSRMGNPPGRNKPTPYEGLINGQWTPVFQIADEFYDARGERVFPESIRRPGSAQAPRPVSPDRVTGPEGQVQYVQPPTGLAPGTVHTVPGAVARTPPPPPSFGSTSVVVGPDGKPVVMQNPRNEGGPSRVVGEAPERAGQVTDQQRQYRTWLKQIDQAVSTQGRNSLTGRARVLTPAERDRLTEQITGVRGLTYNEVSNGAQGGTVQSRGSRTGRTQSDAAKLEQTIRGMFGSSSGVIQGSGVPPPPPPK